MSRACTGGSFLSRDQTIITDEPLTISVKFKRVGTANVQTLAMIGEKDHANGGNSWQLQISASDAIAARTESGASGATQSGGSVGNDTASWHTGILISSGAASRFSGLDGTMSAEGVSNIAVTSANVNCLRIGLNTGSGSNEPLEALIAHVAIWNIALTPTDFTNLHAGANPLTISPSNLKFYYPFVIDELLDHSGNGNTLTNSSTTFNADNPTVDDPPAGSSAALVFANLYRRRRNS
jgi:hypothetical protein